jgi:NDP-sugar pyrophosphorylase family protein
MDMQVAILAGRLATRLRDLTRNQPKSMLKIQGETFHEYQLELLRRGGIKNIVLCIGYIGEQVGRHFGNGRQYWVDIEYSVEDKCLGIAGALKKVESLLNDIVFEPIG